MSRTWHRRLAVLTLAAVMALGGVAGGAPTFTASKLAGGGVSRAYDPETHGSLAVWTADTPLMMSTDRHVYVWDFATASGTPIGTTSDGIDQEHADVSSGRIVYEYDDGGDVDIRMWDSMWNLHMPIAETANDEVDPRIDGNLVVWYVPSADELRYRDLGRGITSAVVPGAHDVECWDVDNGAIIWSYEYSAASDRILRFRPGIDSGAMYIMNGVEDLDISTLQMHGTLIAFTMERTDGGDDDAWYADISSDYGIIRGRVEGNENLFSEQRPVIFHRGVAWETDKMGSTDILFRTVRPTDGTLSAVAGGASDTDTQLDPSLFGRRVVYTKNNGVSDTEVWVSKAAPEVARTSGDDRYLTAVETSKAYFGRANNAVLCTGLNFPDALAAAPFARLVNGPLLLTRPGEVDAATIEELDRLAVEKVYVIGGADVVSNDVMTQITSETGAACSRIYGEDRYQTSAAIAEKMGTLLGGPHTIRRAFFARGDNFPDALALGPVAASSLSPILLVRTNDVPESIQITVDDLDITSGIIAGGTDVVSNGVRDSLRTLMIANGGDDHDPMIVERWGGATRYETAIAIVNGGLEARWIDLDTLGFATGFNFPDALGGGAALGCYGSPLLLTAPTSLPDSVAAFLESHEYEIGRADFFGGIDVVSEAVKTTVTNKLK
ncbi:MAG: cell wall-binding repeat-containing protein [Coriobacteriia bacterium]|nr:cell wall-binding repeat-containing protein [Coriobacteriia bacterium]